MWESTIFLAFTLGLFSAASLPLGTLTAAFWTPGDRTIAVLMAFGGGALLAALTIDLVASALDRGHFGPLAIGCIVGGLLFDGLNQLINNQGGFLRKTSTLVFHFRRRQKGRLRRILRSLGRLDVFRTLEREQANDLVDSAIPRSFRRGERLYGEGDPCQGLYILSRGEVVLRDPLRDMETIETITRGSVFGRLAFFTGAPHGTIAETVTDVDVWIVPRAALDAAMVESHAFADTVLELLRTSEVATYLRERHRLDEEAVARWRDDVTTRVDKGIPAPPAVEVSATAERFVRIANEISRLPLFQGLSTSELRALAARLTEEFFNQGDVIFRQGDHADRLFVVESGEVVLRASGSGRRTIDVASDNDAFGVMSFLTQMNHSLTAVATEESEVWSLRHDDFVELLRRLPHLERHVRDFVQGKEIAGYLESQHGFDRGKAADWVQDAVKGLETVRAMPSASEIEAEIKSHGGAPLAIWLGILLDGIPESLVIGASVLHSSHISLSLIGGLFLSNYPEALSSSVGMRQQGHPFTWVFTMWGSLTLITGIGAALGSIFFVGAPPSAFAFVQGIAAGAMLTMIAETMLPEAFLKGGSVVGMTTLLGFLAAISLKTLE